MLPLYFDLVYQRLVSSRTDPTPYAIPGIGQEQMLSIDFTALRRIAKIGTVFEVVNLTGYSLKISVGSDNNILAAALPGAFTLNGDGTVLTGILDLNTAGISALSSGATTEIEIMLTKGTTEKYTRRFAVVYTKGISLVSSLNPVANDTAMGRLEAGRTFMKKQGDPGEGFVLVSADGAKQAFQYLHNDGSLRSEPLS